MIRYGISLLFSLFLHASLLVGAFASYQNISSLHSESAQKKLSINLKTVSFHSNSKNPLQTAFKKVPPKKIEKSSSKKVTKVEPKKIKKAVVKKQIPLKEVKKKVMEQEEPTVEKQQAVKNDERISNTRTSSDDPLTSSSSALQSQENQNGSATQYIDHYLSKITTLLQKSLYYPRSARKRGIVGTVVVSFVLHRDGSVEHVQVVSSKSDILSRSAVKTIQNLSGKFPKPNTELTLNIPIRYTLNN